MNLQEFETINNSGTTEFRVDMLANQQDRTLIYGYTLDRRTFHAYLKDGRVSRVIYNLAEDEWDVIEDVKSLHDLVPSKRAYPERCDFEVAMLLKDRNIEISYTIFDKSRTPGNDQFFGCTIEDMPSNGLRP